MTLVCNFRRLIPYSHSTWRLTELALGDPMYDRACPILLAATGSCKLSSVHAVGNRDYREPGIVDFTWSSHR